jgi:hypothetical protein
MTTEITVTIRTDAVWTPDVLRQAVADLDEADSGEGEGIYPANVTAWDVIQYIARGDLTVVSLIDKADQLYEGNDLHEALDGVIVNEMKAV